MKQDGFRNNYELGLLSSLKYSGNYMYHLLQQSLTLQFILTGFKLLTLNSGYFLEQHQPVDLHNGDCLCFLRGSD
jgi:hypothetical protein